MERHGDDADEDSMVDGMVLEMVPVGDLDVPDTADGAKFGISEEDIEDPDEAEGEGDEGPGAADPVPWQRRMRYAMAILASILRGCYGVVTRHAIDDGAQADLLVLGGAFGWILGGVFWALFVECLWCRERRSRLDCLGSVVYGALSGAITCGNILCLTYALELQHSAVVVPITNTSFVCTLILCVLVQMEHCDLYKVGATVAALLCIVLLAGSSLWGEGHGHGYSV